MGTEQNDLRITAIKRALASSRSAVAAVGAMDPTLGGRLDTRFTLLARDVEDGLAKQPSPEKTAELLRRGEDLVAETLAFVGGAAALQLGLDGGISSLALAWLDRLSHNANIDEVGVVIPASTEFTGMLTQVVRLRLPSDGIWSLPVAVHEYGHFVAAVLTRRDVRDTLPTTFAPVEELLNRTGSKTDLPRLYWHGHELFADAFATATVGPAYTRYCVHYRFDPNTAQTPTATHPAPARRVRIQLRVLRLLAVGTQATYVSDEATAIGERWDRDVAAAGLSPAVSSDAQLDELEDRLIALLDDARLAGLRYRDHVQARALADKPLGSAQAAGSVEQALNAAWSRRLRGGPGESVDAIAGECQRLVAGALSV
jgi:hypothetical protein